MEKTIQTFWLTQYYVFMSLYSILLFQYEELPLAFLVMADLVVMNSLNFCLSQTVFISPSFLKDGFAGYSILGCQFFFLSPL